ncbi:40S ribosomal protein eS12 [Magnusiomyces paraingens]|uniref:40S ribosomal protein S12 n=1 Tax=Magnusiomyces paraingens TaxID=2606893 RepID=A0A5E8BTQ8_9ASCO|nr:uncharacterized protein SAPINGB_P004097 [Saprochaete ingens]VVT54481.1 unnamed protein product [Saprochaete ingens]
MSDVEEVEVQEVAVEAVGQGEISIEDALQGALRIALAHNGLARGLRSASKALSTRQAVLAVLCDSVTEESYVKLVEALCNEPENKIPLIKVSDAKQLGEWVGLAQLDRDGNPRKVVGCGVAVITNWGKDSPERQVLLEHFKSL